MADPTLVNGQITDAVTQSNVKVLADAPAEALAMVYQTMGHTVGLGMQNAASAQQQMNTINQTVTTQAAGLLMSMDTAASARATETVFSGNDVSQQIMSLLAAVAGGQEASKTAGAT